MGIRKNPTDIINRAQSNGFKSGLHHEEDKKTGLQEYDEKTLGAQDQVLEKYAIWAFRYLNNKHVTVFEEFEAMLLCKDAALPEIHHLKDFWRFYKDQARGRLSERPTARSLKASAKSFNGGFKRRTGNSVPAETIAEINLWIGGPLTSEEGSGVTNIERPKYNYKPQDLDRNLKALWSRSDIGVRHERERFQFHFLLLLFCDTGARRGGLFKAGIPYKDIHLVLERQDGVPRFFFQVAQRTVKNNKDPKNRRFGVTGREHRLLRYNAVFLLLHFAIADGALDHDFFTQILNGKGDGSIEWKEAALELPVCRSVDRNGCLTSEAMTFAVFERVLKKVFMGEYNFDRASMHMIRRELGKQLDNRYTATERSQHVLHNDNRIFGQSYVAFASSCDGLAAFMRETADHTAVEYFQGLHRFHQPGMPVRLPAALLAKVETSAELAAYDNEIHSAVSPDARAEAQRARKNAVKRLRKKTLQEYREECLKTLRKDRLINGCHATNDTLDPLNEVFPEKRRVSEAMTSDLEEFSVMEDALRLLTMSSEKYHRAYEAPQNGMCPYCHIDVSRLARRNLHIHHCRRDEVARELGVLFSTLTFCYFCNEFYTPTEWEQDCRRHLSAPVVHCGSLTYRHTLVRPAFCLLCTQSNDLAAAERLQSWERDVKALDHIDRSHGWHWTCLHCNFVSDSKESGRNHLHDAHGYQSRRPKAGLTKPRAIDHNISMDELSADMNCDQGAESLEMLAGRGDSSSDHAPEEKAEMVELTLHNGFLETNFDARTSDPCTPPLEWSETSDDVVDRLMDEWLLLPLMPPSESELTGSEKSYPEDDLMMSPVDYKAPYYLLPTQLDTKSKGIGHPLETAEMIWEHHSESNCTRLEEQPLYPPESPTHQQLVIELRSISTREDYQSFENLSSTNNEEQTLSQTGKERFRQKLNSFCSSPGSRPKKARSRKPGLSHQVHKTRRVRIRFTPDEDRLLLKLKADPTLTWEKIYELFSIEYPRRRSLGALQMHHTTKLQ